MLLVLDTTVLIDYLRGRPVVDRVAALRSTADVPATTSINLEELARGLRPAELPRARRLIDGLVVLPVDARSGWTAGEWRRRYATTGLTLAQADCLIAATASCNSAVLATGNPRDFPMSELQVLHWPVGE